MIVNKYNWIITTLNSVEEPLVIDKIKKMDKIISPGIEVLEWRSKDVNTFINKAQIIVDEVHRVVTKMKDDLSKIKELLQKINNPIV